VNDVLEHTPTWKDRLLTVRDFLIRVRNSHLTLRPTKCSVEFFCVSYLLHCVGNQTLQTKSDMANKILPAPKPTVLIKSSYDRFWV